VKTAVAGPSPGPCARNCWAVDRLSTQTPPSDLPRDPHAFDAEMAKAIEQDYLTPEITEQRRRTLQALALQPGERVLDAGCGPGLLVRAMSEPVGECGHVLGIDNAAAMLDLARARCRGMENVTIASGDALNLPVGSVSLDALSCTQLLLLIDDVPGALQEFQRVLKPGGRLAVVETDWRSAVLNTTDKNLTHRMFEAWDDMAANPNLPARLAPMLVEGGFRVAAAAAIPVLNTVWGPEAFSYNFVNGLARQCAERDIVSKDEAAAWLDDLARKGRDGAYFFCVNRFLFTAVKG